MRRVPPVLIHVSMFLCLVCCGCSGNKSSTSSSGPPPTATSVTVMPGTATLSKGQSQAFSATVAGVTDQSVFWSIVGAQPADGDATHGFISNGGVYVAPATVPSPATVTIKATSGADPTKSGTATVTIQQGSSVSVVVMSNPGSAPTFGSQQFAAVVTGNANTAVTWQVNGMTGGNTTTGTVSTMGLFSAPHSVPVLSSGNNAGQTSEVVLTAISQADSTASDSVLVTIVPPQQNSQSTPIKLGTSGGNSKDSSTSSGSTVCCGGTLGSLVVRSGTQFVLSDNHILARSDIATLGEPIVQPGLIDNGCNPGTMVANLSQFFNLENGGTPKVDAAIAQVGSNTVDSAGTILQLGGTNNGNQPTDGPPHAGSGVTPVVGRAVAKSGRSTGLTCSGVISAIQVSTSVQYQKGCGTGSTFSATFTDAVSITAPNGGANEFSALGDSGALIVTQDTADPVALLFAGSDTDTVGNPVSDVLNAFKDSSGNMPTFVGSSTTHAVAACSIPGPLAAIAAQRAMQQITPSAEDIRRAVLTRDLYAPALMAHPQVQALGVGASLDHPGKPAILFFVTKGQPLTGLSAQVDEIRTRVIEGDLFAQRGVLTAEQSAALEQSAAPPQFVYPISDAEFARAKAIHAAHVDEWMKQPGVQGVGISSSADSPGEAALMIFLIRGVPHPEIPATIDGLRTRVRESSRFRAGVGDRASQRNCSLGVAAPKSAERGVSAKP